MMLKFQDVNTKFQTGINNDRQYSINEKYIFINNEMNKAKDWLKFGSKMDEVLVENLLFLVKYGEVEHRIYSLKILGSFSINFQITRFTPLDGIKFLNEAAKLGDQDSIFAISNIKKDILTSDEIEEVNSFTLDMNC